MPPCCLPEVRGRTTVRGSVVDVDGKHQRPAHRAPARPRRRHGRPSKRPRPGLAKRAAAHFRGRTGKGRPDAAPPGIPAGGRGASKSPVRWRGNGGRRPGNAARSAVRRRWPVRRIPNAGASPLDRSKTLWGFGHGWRGLVPVSRLHGRVAVIAGGTTARPRKPCPHSEGTAPHNDCKYGASG